MSETLISADHVSVIRKGKRVLDHVSLSVQPGEFITVVGPNGAGKTILLHTLIGLIAPDEGRVTRKTGLKIGYMPQRLAPEATMPVTVTRFLRLVRGADRAEIARVLEMVQATPYADRPLAALSGGELQRVLLARALLHKPDLLVLDEPAQNLDIGGELAFYRLLEEIYKQHKCSVLMVSHDLHMVMASTSRVVCLFHHVCCSGAPDAVARDPEFSALFGADMAQMMASYHHTHSHDHEHDHEH